MTNWALIAITATFTLVLSINAHTSAFHENLGIDDKKASQLYQTNPNDPAILQWKNALQSAITGMDKCFDIETALECEDLIPTIISHCVSHPNTLLACNDSRFPQYPAIVKQAEEARKKAEEARIKAEAARLEPSRPLRIQAYGNGILNMCFINNFNASSNLACDLEMRSLQGECQAANNTYNYCKDERFLGYLAQHNSTVSPYSNLTGNSSSSNSTYP